MFLASKGIKLKDSEKAFVEFGKYLTDADDSLVTVAIEYTLKVQREFDGSYYIALLEAFKQHKITNKKSALRYCRNLFENKIGEPVLK